MTGSPHLFAIRKVLSNSSLPLYCKPRLYRLIITIRMMQSDIDSFCSRNLCSHCHVAASISVRQLPFGKRRPGGGSTTLAIRARHSSVISISGIV